MSWSRFPPRTREVRFDEKWAFVAKKEKNCDEDDPADDHKGDTWDHVAFDPESRLVLSVVPGFGAEAGAALDEWGREVHLRTSALEPSKCRRSASGMGRPPPLMSPARGRARRVAETACRWRIGTVGRSP